MDYIFVASFEVMLLWFSFRIDDKDWIGRWLYTHNNHNQNHCWTTTCKLPIQFPSYPISNCLTKSSFKTLWKLGPYGPPQILWGLNAQTFVPVYAIEKNDILWPSTMLEYFRGWIRSKSWRGRKHCKFGLIWLETHVFSQLCIQIAISWVWYVILIVHRSLSSFAVYPLQWNSHNPYFSSHPH